MTEALKSHLKAVKEDLELRQKTILGAVEELKMLEKKKRPLYQDEWDEIGVEAKDRAVEVWARKFPNTLAEGIRANLRRVVSSLIEINDQGRDILAKKLFVSACLWFAQELFGDLSFSPFFYCRRRSPRSTTTAEEAKGPSS